MASASLTSEDDPRHSSGSSSPSSFDSQLGSAGRTHPLKDTNILKGPPPPATLKSSSQTALILLAVAVTVSLLGLVLIIVAHSKSRYYTSVCLKENKGPNGQINSHSGDLLEEMTCEEKTTGSYDVCKYLERHWEKIRHPNDSRMPHRCPSKYLVVTWVYLLPECWAISLLVLVVLLIVQGSRSATIFRIGGMISMGEGAVLLLAALCISIFLLTMLASTAWCTPEYLTHKQSRQSEEIRALFLSRTSSRKAPKGKDAQKKCDKDNKLAFQPGLLLSGAVITALAGILFLVAGGFMIRIGKGKIEARGNGPRHKGGG